jgi:glycosyltransferase involved in cell wall biosynthesis
MDPLISLVIPCYNQAHYLQYALSSVLAQTYANWEAIVINDGSTDQTADMVKRFDDPRIQLIEQSNQGLAAARNAGIRAAQGKYLAFLDADDEWAAEFLSTCVAAFQIHASPQLAGVYTSCTFIDTVGQVLPQSGNIVLEPSALYEHLLEGGFFPVHAALIRVDAARSVGMFDIHLRGNGTEDWDFWLRVSKQYELLGVPKPLARYRVYLGSMSTNVEQMHLNRMAVLAKHFGQLEGEPNTWSAEKRHAYGFAYRSSAIGFIARGQPAEGWTLLKQAAIILPSVLTRLDTYYEIMFGDQPKGIRGQANLLDLDKTGADLLARLKQLLAASPPELSRCRKKAYANAYLALTMLYDQAGNWNVARRYIYRVLKTWPNLLANYPAFRRLVKLHMGHRVVNTIQRVFISRHTLSSTQTTTGETRQ